MLTVEAGYPYTPTPAVIPLKTHAPETCVFSNFSHERENLCAPNNAHYLNDTANYPVLLTAQKNTVCSINQ